VSKSIKKHGDPPRGESYKIQDIWSSCSYRRMVDALYLFYVESKQLERQIIKNEIPIQLNKNNCVSQAAIKFTQDVKNTTAPNHLTNSVADADLSLQVVSPIPRNKNIEESKKAGGVQKENSRKEILQPSPIAPILGNKPLIESNIGSNNGHQVLIESRKEIANKKKEPFVSPTIIKTILGERQDDSNNADGIIQLLPKMNGQVLEQISGLPSLNKSQSDAINYALCHPIALIQGPPGTGKTITSTYLVYHLALRYPKQVLVCSASNAAIDNITYWIGKTGIKVARLCASSRECIDTNIKQYCVHELIKTQKGYDMMHRLLTKKEKNGDLSDAENSMLKAEKRKAYIEVIKEADVLCTTCIGAFDPILDNISYSRILIDEATQAKEPEVLIPIMKGAKQLILVGDHKQLKPCVKNIDCSNSGLDKSMFERMNGYGVRSFLLTVQYRMHPEIAHISSQLFYSNKLIDGVTASQRSDPYTQSLWPNPDVPILFVDISGREELSSTGKSYLNQTEIICLLDLLDYLISLNKGNKTIGIITPYKGQKAAICNYINSSETYSKSKEAFKKVEVSSVDSFQGRELDYVILSLVRSDEYSGIGFLKEECRLNVSITRARYGLIIIGNTNVLRSYGIWKSLIDLLNCKRALIVNM
jgi:superfamily I DNA and/or RNA helicase